MIPYITLFHKFNNQFILEGCLEKRNFKILIKYDTLFDEYYISHQFTSLNKKKKVYSLVELIELELLDSNVIYKVSKILFDKMNEDYLF